MGCDKMAEQIEMLFGEQICVAEGTLYSGVWVPRSKGHMWVWHVPSRCNVLLSAWVHCVVFVGRKTNRINHMLTSSLVMCVCVCLYY